MKWQKPRATDTAGWDINKDPTLHRAVSIEHINYSNMQP